MISDRTEYHATHDDEGVWVTASEPRREDTGYHKDESLAIIRGMRGAVRVDKGSPPRWRSISTHKDAPKGLGRTLAEVAQDYVTREYGAEPVLSRDTPTSEGARKMAAAAGRPVAEDVKPNPVTAEDSWRMGHLGVASFGVMEGTPERIH